MRYEGSVDILCPLASSHWRTELDKALYGYVPGTFIQFGDPRVCVTLSNEVDHDNTRVVARIYYVLNLKLPFFWF